MSGLFLVGEVVDIDKSDWEFNGRTGTSYALFVGIGKREQPIRVKITEQQFAQVTLGATVELPVRVTAQESNFGSPRLRYTLDQECDLTTAGSALSPAAYAPSDF